MAMPLRAARGIARHPLVQFLRERVARSFATTARVRGLPHRVRHVDVCQHVHLNIANGYDRGPARDRAWVRRWLSAEFA